jgi:hypothetical protein
MYWNNPLVEFHWPNKQDPIQISSNQGMHCLFWNPHCEFRHFSTNQRLNDLCEWANQWLEYDGPVGFLAEPRNHYDIANLVKLNMWIRDIRAQGIIKPFLVLDQGDGTYLAGNGDSRLRCLERLPEIQTVPGFITTHHSRAHLYSDFEPITTFDRFAELCGADLGQLFTFRFTDSQAPYGLYWYEFNSSRTRSVTPSESQCLIWVEKYFKQHPHVRISPEWFDQDIDWHNI